MVNKTKISCRKPHTHRDAPSGGAVRERPGNTYALVDIPHP